MPATAAKAAASAPPDSERRFETRQAVSSHLPPCGGGAEARRTMASNGSHGQADHYQGVNQHNGGRNQEIDHQANPCSGVRTYRQQQGRRLDAGVGWDLTERTMRRCRPHFQTPTRAGWGDRDGRHGRPEKRLGAVPLARCAPLYGPAARKNLNAPRGRPACTLRKPYDAAAPLWGEIRPRYNRGLGGAGQAAPLDKQTRGNQAHGVMLSGLVATAPERRCAPAIFKQEK